jgi:hypothetical protein
MPEFLHSTNSFLKPQFIINGKVMKMYKEQNDSSGSFAKPIRDEKAYESLIRNLNLLETELAKFHSSFFNKERFPDFASQAPKGFGRILELIKSIQRTLKKFPIRVLNQIDVNELQQSRDDLQQFYDNYSEFAQMKGDKAQSIELMREQLENRDVDELDFEEVQDLQEGLQKTTKDYKEEEKAFMMIDYFYESLKELLQLLGLRLHSWNANPTTSNQPTINTMEGGALYSVGDQSFYGMRKYD